MQCPACTNEIAGDECPRCATRFLPVVPHALSSGVELRGGNYQVVQVLAQGGFGITYHCIENHLKCPVVIKEFFPLGCSRNANRVEPGGGWDAESMGEGRRRFLKEGQALARFDHPGIVRIFGAFEENDTAYLVMEYLRGATLESIVSQRHTALAEAEAVAYLRQIAEPLSVIHANGLLHLDLKPSNVMATYDGRVVLIDFGAAREFIAGVSRTQSTALTTGYAPLEQYSKMGQRSPATDIYALAATGYFLLTGTTPPAATDRAVGVPLQSPAAINSTTGATVSAAIEAGLAMDPSARPRTVAEFVDLVRAPGPPTTSAAFRLPSLGGASSVPATIAVQTSAGAPSKAAGPVLVERLRSIQRSLTTGIGRLPPRWAWRAALVVVGAALILWAAGVERKSREAAEKADSDFRARVSDEHSSYVAAREHASRARQAEAMSEKSAAYTDYLHREFARHLKVPYQALAPSTAGWNAQLKSLRQLFYAHQAEYGFYKALSTCMDRANAQYRAQYNADAADYLQDVVDVKTRYVEERKRPRKALNAAIDRLNPYFGRLRDKIMRDGSYFSAWDRSELERMASEFKRDSEEYVEYREAFGQLSIATTDLIKAASDNDRAAYLDADRRYRKAVSYE